ncbi:uncharacterized protein J3R85_017321 [Psidium guajava]|nr:uncharacterized protein J3R85_017321 [Psidium guajava]
MKQPKSPKVNIGSSGESAREVAITVKVNACPGGAEFIRPILLLYTSTGNGDIIVKDAESPAVPRVIEPAVTIPRWIHRLAGGPWL